jgi:tetratricopeptide (TPR) repeat protein
MSGISSIGLIPLLAMTALAQWENRSTIMMSDSGNHERSVVRGQIYSNSPILESLTVELLAQESLKTVSASTEKGGEFEFQGIAPGTYQLRVMAGSGSVVHEEFVLINSGYQNLSIQISNSPQRASTHDRTVSIRQLQHKVPAQAQKEFAKGQAAFKKDHNTAALEHFKNAIELDPEFADAFNGSGVTYAALGQLQQAADQFQRAVDLVPDHPGATANLSVMLCNLKRYREADLTARRALKFDPGLLKVRYVLGLSLLNDGGSQAEALDNLERAAGEIPRAHVLIAKILTETNRPQEAAKHLEDYLNSSPADDSDRPRIENWLEQLNHHQ